MVITMLIWRCLFAGSSNGHSPVLNLSKGGGDHSGSEAGHTGPEDEGDEEENVTDVDDEMEEKHHPGEWRIRHI